MTHSQHNLEPSREAGKCGCVTGATQNEKSDAHWLDSESIHADAFLPILTYDKTAELYEALIFLDDNKCGVGRF
jgi:hypothetical protein